MLSTLPMRRLQMRRQPRRRPRPRRQYPLLRRRPQRLMAASGRRLRSSRHRLLQKRPLRQRRPRRQKHNRRQKRRRRRRHQLRRRLLLRHPLDRLRLHPAHAPSRSLLLRALGPLHRQAPRRRRAPHHLCRIQASSRSEASRISKRGHHERCRLQSLRHPSLRSPPISLLPDAAARRRSARTLVRVSR